MAKRLKEVKPALEKMVMDNLVDAKAREDDLDYLLSFTEPIVDMLRAEDTDAPVLHSIYDIWDTMIENVKAIIFEHEDKDHITGQSDFFDAIHEILEARWTKSNTPLHCIAHSLVPKYYHESWLQGGSNGIQRLAPHENEEVSTNRSNGFGYFNQPHVIEARMYEEPISWWHLSCCHNQLLHHVVGEIGAHMVIFIASKEIVIDFCMIVGGDRFDINGSPIEFAELSINEPELELVTFDDAVEDVQPDDVGHVADKFKAKALKSLEAEHHWMINLLVTKMVKEHVNCGRLEALINQVFKSKEELFNWVHDVGRKNSFVIVIKTSDYGDGHRTPRIYLTCERSGQYRAHKKLKGDDSNKTIVKLTGTKKCGCPFELRAHKLMADDDWMLDVACGMHNHAPAKHFEGHSFAERLFEEEISLLVDMSKSMIRPKKILVTLKQKDALNATTTTTNLGFKDEKNLSQNVHNSSSKLITMKSFRHPFCRQSIVAKRS
ncbi:hypothetical protein CsSME_00020320 [Camellia sinensis var. sinensis]